MMITGLYTTAIALSTDDGARWALTRIALATAAEALIATGEAGTAHAARLLAEPIRDLVGVHFPGISAAGLRYAAGVPGSARDLYATALITGAAVLRHLHQPGDMPLLLEQLAEDVCSCGGDDAPCGCPTS